MFEQNFGHSSNFTILGEILKFIKIEELKFSEVNELILKRMMKFLDLNTEIVISSCLGVTGKRSERILNILKELEASVMLPIQTPQITCWLMILKINFMVTSIFSYQCHYSQRN